jgi:hypothetical protein
MKLNTKDVSRTQKISSKETNQQTNKQTAAAVQRRIPVFDVSRCARNTNIFIITIWKEKEEEVDDDDEERE